MCVCVCVFLTIGLFFSIAFVWRRIQEHEGEHVQVPHAVNPGEERAVYLNRVISPVPVSLVHLRTHTHTFMCPLLIWSCICVKGGTRIVLLISCLRPHTWLMMKKMTVMAAHARVTNIRNLKRKIRPWVSQNTIRWDLKQLLIFMLHWNQYSTFILVKCIFIIQNYIHHNSFSIFSSFFNWHLLIIT